MEKMAFCKNCGDFRAYDINEVPVETDRDGIAYMWTKIVPTCARCGKKVDVLDINFMNIDADLDAYYEARSKIVD